MNHQKIVLRKSLLLFIAAIFFTALSCANDNKNGGSKPIPVTRVSIIPEPESLVHGRNNIAIPKDATISKNITGVKADLIKQTLTSIVGGAGSAENDNAFIRIHHDNTLKDEGYLITIEDTGCNIYYKTETGLLWGIQTLRQILLQNHTGSNGTKSIPILTLSDAPKKSWRGFHIDLARHMFTVDYLKKLADCLSFYKINKLQLHLTDDQGWRIEIKKYPTLTSVGGWREFDDHDNECIRLSESDKSYAIDPRFIRNGYEYGGYYTQEQLKDFVLYAAARGIEIIPEIDMPGHFSAAMRAFPNLSCTNKPGWGKEFSYPICAGKTENYPFLKDIIDEVADIFPGKYFHIGADEVEKDNWKKCENCQKLIREKNLINTDGLQNYFVKEMADYIRNSKGKEVMAWDDAFSPLAPQQLTYTYWRDWLPEQPAKITQRGLPVIFMEWGRFYFSADPSDKALKSLYEFEFEPQFKGIVRNKVLGFQACVWTEIIPSESKLGYHVFPSLQAFSELAWGSKRDWGSFQSRLRWHLKWLDQSGFNYRTPGFLK